MHWLLMLEGIRLAHPALYAGWIALAAYLGVYLPLFIGLTRVAVRQLHVPLMVAAPIVWVGLELARGHLITGFSMGLLAHTQAEFPRFIQIADLAGGYTLSFVIMLVAACLTQAAFAVWRGAWSSGSGGWGLRSITQPLSKSVFPLLTIAVAIGCTLAYGHWRLHQSSQENHERKLRVALIQGSLDTVFEVSPQRMRQTMDQYRELTEKAAAKQANLDLVVWPESAFVVSETVLEEPLVPPPAAQMSADELRQRLTALQDDFQTLLAGEAVRASTNTAAPHPGAKLLVGTTTYCYGARTKVYNSALLADRSGEVVNRYYKTHPVMFGEYIPFGEAIPLLYKITPMTGGLSIGDGPKVFEVAGFNLTPSICFESTIPHLIRNQLDLLRRRGTPADVLVNVTNDGWFWGTAMLDLHFRCGIFRAVENRKPLIVAANTGISTFVDGNGVVRQRGQKRQPEVLIAEVRPDGRFSPYERIGDWPAWLCTAACMALAFVGFRWRPAA
jgi:apolipoprotein N-acyltransferase